MRLTYMSVKDEVHQIGENPSIPTQRSGRDDLDQQSNPPTALLNTAPPTDVPNSSGSENFGAQLDDLFTRPDDCFFDATFDWFTWSDQETLGN